MRISLDWLREYVDIDVPLEALVERLHGIGLPVEQVERAGSDTVLEIELTTNRPDCMSVLGIAREVALLLGGPLRAPTPSPVKPSPAAPARGSVEVADRAGCRGVEARVVGGVAGRPRTGGREGG